MNIPVLSYTQIFLSVTFFRELAILSLPAISRTTGLNFDLFEFRGPKDSNFHSDSNSCLEIKASRSHEPEIHLEEWRVVASHPSRNGRGNRRQYRDKCHPTSKMKAEFRIIDRDMIVTLTTRYHLAHNGRR
jgi:hypothetical protein